MKIKKVVIENIHSLYGRFEIDFDQKPLSEASLFLIAGQTGSGKTTILDAICLALYGKYPRTNDGVNKNKVQENGSVLNHHAKYALAEVDYVCAKGEFKSRWSIEYNRNHNLNEYEMELFDLTTSEKINQKKSEVADYNLRNIGLSYDQFTKTILLSQGAFQEFLHAKEADRIELLESITGGQLFRDIGKKINQVFKEKGQEILLLQTQRGNISLLSEEEVILKQKKLEENQKQEQALAQQKDQLQLVLKSKENYLKLFKEQQQNDAKQKNLEVRRVDIETKKQKLSQLNKARDIQQYWIVKEKKKEEIVKADQELNKVQSQMKQANEELLQQKTQLLNYFSAGKNSSNDHELLNAFNQYLIDIEKSDSELKSKENDLVARAKELKSIACLQSLNTIHDARPNWAGMMEQIHALKLKYDSACQALSVKDFNNQQYLAMHASLKLLTLIEQSQNQLKQIEREHQQGLLKRKELEQQFKQILNQEKEIEKQQEQIDQQFLAFKTSIQQASLSEAIDLIRNSIQEHEPCLVCGSTSHPALSHEGIEKEKHAKLQLTSLEAEQKTIQENKNALVKVKESSSNELFQHDLILKNLVDQIQILQQKIQNDESEYVIKKAELTSSEIWDALSLQEKVNYVNAYQVLEAMYGQLQELNPVIAPLEYFIQHSEAYRSLLVTRNQQINIKLGEVAKVRQAMSDQFNQALQQYNHLNQKSELLQQALKLNQEEYIQLEHEWKVALTKASFAQEAMFVALYHDLKLVPSLQTEVDGFAMEVEQIVRNAKRLNQELEQLGSFVCRSEEDLISVKQEYEQLNQAYLQCRDLIISLQKDIEQDALQRSKIEAVNQQLRVLELEFSDYKLLNDYLGDATGKTFSALAQKITLRYLLSLANQRLLKLSDRYVFALDKMESSDLFVTDLHQGNMTRNVKTLSGGETFLLSLVLALCVSDVASENNPVKTLFIDEGFGTLDEESLEQALEMLESVQRQEDKVIGIISHVALLKERIGVKIQLTKKGQGNSLLHVVQEE
jgi:exonuclease SbcC